MHNEKLRLRNRLNKFLKSSFVSVCFGITAATVISARDDLERLGMETCVWTATVASLGVMACAIALVILQKRKKRESKENSK